MNADAMVHLAMAGIPQSIRSLFRPSDLPPSPVSDPDGQPDKAGVNDTKSRLETAMGELSEVLLMERFRKILDRLSP